MPMCWRTRPRVDESVEDVDDLELMIGTSNHLFVSEEKAHG